MASADQQLDLSQLAVDRTGKPSGAARPSRWLTRYALPAAVLAGFVGLFVWSARDSFLPAQRVTVTPVVVSRAEIQREGTPLFQAAGWVEPRPTKVMASALAGGVIDRIHVIEGQHVARGEPIATLIDTDAQLALSEAKAAVQLRAAEVRSAKAAFRAAEVNLAQPVRQQAELANANAQLCEVQMALGKLPYDAARAGTDRELAAENVRRKEQAGQAIPGRLLREARAVLAAAESTADELQAREPKLRHQIESLQQRCDALGERLRLLTDETRAAAEAEASLAASKARLDQSRLQVDTAELRLERMQVRAPIDGCVLSVEAWPGQWLSGAAQSAGRGGSAVVGLYDPKRLQVRVDVRLEDVPQVTIGQAAQIETAALREPLAGEVVSITTSADIQKNTLQVKVAVTDPPQVLKPEMLAKVTFLAPPSLESGEGDLAKPLRLFIPEQLATGSDAEAFVWTVDLAASVAVRKTVALGGQTSNGLVEVTRGLTPTDKLVVAGRDSLSDGQRVAIAGDDTTLGGPSAQPIVRTALTD